MAAFAPGQTLRSRTPTVEVDPLEPGRWRFRLVVVDDERNVSEPADLIVDVQRRGIVIPPVLDPRIRIPVRPGRPIR